MLFVVFFFFFWKLEILLLLLLLVMLAIANSTPCIKLQHIIYVTPYVAQLHLADNKTSKKKKSCRRDMSHI